MLLEDLLRSLVPPCLAKLMSQDDWAVAGDYWEEHGDERRAALCRGTLCVGGAESGRVVPSRSKKIAEFPTERYQALSIEVADASAVPLVTCRFFVPEREYALDVEHVTNVLSEILIA